MAEAALHACAAGRAAAWGGIAAPPRLVCHRENAVFEVTLADGRRAALRLHRPGYRSVDAIASELRWCEALADAGFACPWPLRTTDEDLIHDPEDGLPVASVTLWLDARPIGGRGHPFAGSPAAQAALYRDLGGLLADLHLTSDAVAPLDLARPDWDLEALCGKSAPAWGSFRDNPAFAAGDIALLSAACDAAAARLDARGTAGCGLIHADVLQENVLKAGSQLYLIDFDDGGHGHRPYDLATALVQHVENPAFKLLAEALIEGYRDGGGALSDADIADLPMFVMLRAMASAGWIVNRAPQDDPRRALYAARAIACARAFLDA